MAANTPTLRSCIQDARRRLERAGIEATEAALDADLLARHALGGWERGRLLAAMRDPAPAGFADAFELLVQRREAREPAAYITGRREFWSIQIEVAPGVLIPRPETEFIVEEVLERVPAGAGSLRIADVGTGSGCLAVALTRWLPTAHVTAIDVSPLALAIAARNVTAHEVAARVSLVRGDLLDAHDGPFDVIVSNPPYVPGADIPTLQREVRDFEPAGALDGGPDGLDIIRRLVPEAASRLVEGGWLVFEFGFGQGDGVCAILAAEPRLELVVIREDLAGIPRIAVAQRRRKGSGPNPESPIPWGAVALAKAAESRMRGALMSCLFCRVINGEIPSKKVYEDESVIAFHDVNPQAPVHVLIVPRTHIATLNDLAPEDSALLGDMVRRAAAIAKDLGIDARGYRTVFNCNREAGQSVFHIHLHLLGGRPMGWPPG